MPYSINQYITQVAGGSGINNWSSPNFTAVSGECLILFLYWNHTSSLLTSLTDTVGTNDTWLPITTLDLSGGHRWRAYYLPNAVGGSCTVRAGWNGGISFPKFQIVSVSGLSTSPLNTFAIDAQGAPGTGVDAITSGLTATLSRSPAMLLGYSYNYGAVDAPDVGTGFTSAGTDGGRIRLEHKRLTSIDATAATFTNSPSSAHLTIAVVMTETFSEIAADSFDTNGATLGANWTDLDPGWSVSSQQATTTTTATADSAKYTGASFDADQWAQCSIGTVVEATFNEGAGPALRCQSGALGDLIFLQGNAVETRIYKRLGGSYTLLGTNGPPVTTNDVLYLEVQGSIIVAKKNGTAICGSPLDTSGDLNAIPTTGAPGIWGFSTAGGATLDNWSAGDFTDHGTSTGVASGTAAGVTGTATAILSQIAVPISDGVINSWLSTGANLWSTLDESPANDADYIYTDTLSSKCRVKLTVLGDPISSSNHVLSFRLRGNGAATVNVYLYSGGTGTIGSGTLIKSYSYAAHSAVLTSYNETLAGAEADLISDYGNLYLEFEAV